GARRGLTAGDALLDEPDGDAVDLAPAAEQHLANRRRRVGLRPGEREQAGAAQLPALQLDLGEHEADRDRDPIPGTLDRRDPPGELGHLLVGDEVAAREDELVLALEIGVDRPDRQAAGADDVLHRRAVEAALGEHAGRRADDPLADFLFVFGADSRHNPSGEKRMVALFHGSPRKTRLQAMSTFDGLTKRMLILYCPATASNTHRLPPVPIRPGCQAGPKGSRPMLFSRWGA